MVYIPKPKKQQPRKGGTGVFAKRQPSSFSVTTTATTTTATTTSSAAAQVSLQARKLARETRARPWLVTKDKNPTAGPAAASKKLVTAQPNTRKLLPKGTSAPQRKVTHPKSLTCRSAQRPQQRQPQPPRSSKPPQSLQSLSSPGCSEKSDSSCRTVLHHQLPQSIWDIPDSPSSSGSSDWSAAIGHVVNEQQQIPRQPQPQQQPQSQSLWIIPDSPSSSGSSDWPAAVSHVFYQQQQIPRQPQPQQHEQEQKQQQQQPQPQQQSGPAKPTLRERLFRLKNRAAPSAQLSLPPSPEAPMENPFINQPRSVQDETRSDWRTALLEIYAPRQKHNVQYKWLYTSFKPPHSFDPNEASPPYTPSVNSEASTLTEPIWAYNGEYVTVDADIRDYLAPSPCPIRSEDQRQRYLDIGAPLSLNMSNVARPESPESVYYDCEEELTTRLSSIHIRSPLSGRTLVTPLGFRGYASGSDLSFLSFEDERIRSASAHTRSPPPSRSFGCALAIRSPLSSTDSSSAHTRSPPPSRSFGCALAIRSPLSYTGSSSAHTRSPPPSRSFGCALAVRSPVWSSSTHTRSPPPSRSFGCALAVRHDFGSGSDESPKYVRGPTRIPRPLFSLGLAQQRQVFR